MRIDKATFTRKPNKVETAIITNNINKLVNKNYSLDELADALQSGQSIVIDWIDGKRKVENFVRTNYIGLDIDCPEANFQETGEKLVEHGYNWYIRYKSFSNGDIDGDGNVLDKHRYIIKFDEYLTMDEALQVYRHISTFLNVDASTIKSLCRLWYGTHIPITKSDRLGHEVSKQEIFKKLPKTTQVQENNLERLEHTVEFIIQSEDFNKFQETLECEVLNWEYERIRSGIYSACVIMYLETDNEDYINEFYNCVELNHPKGLSKVKEFKYYFSHDVREKMVYYRNALNLIGDFASITPKSVKYVYDILQDCDFIDLKHDEHISTDDIRDVESGVNLLVAPAGSGKTTAIIELALEEPDIYRVLIVPTIAICEQLQKKYGHIDSFEFRYSNSKNIDPTHDKLITGHTNKSLSICTYDSYVYANISEEHILFIDEAHELISFHSMGGKTNIVNHILYNTPDNTVYVTATPFNLGDVFDKKVMFRKDTNKSTTITECNNVLQGLVDLLTHQVIDEKALVYINSKKKMYSIKQKLEERLPHIKVGTISSHQRDGAYVELLTTGTTTYDVVITTKFLNIGFDIQGVFQNLVYADRDVKVNDLLQFFNRERQVSKFHVLMKSGVETIGLNVNTRCLTYQSKLSNMLSNYDKNILDRKHVLGVMNKHIVTDNVFYQQSRLDIKLLCELFTIFYPNFKTIILNHDKHKTWEDERVDVVEELNKYIQSGDMNLDLNDFLGGSQLDFSDAELSDGLIKKIYKTFACVRRNVEYISNTLLSNDGDYYTLNVDVHQFLNMTDRFYCLRFEDQGIRSLLLELSNQKELYSSDVLKYIDKLNIRGVYFDNKVWNEYNFKQRLDKLNIFFEKKRIRIHGERVSVYYNKSLFVDDDREEVRE